MSSSSIPLSPGTEGIATDRLVDGSRHVLWITLAAVLLLVVVAGVALRGRFA